MVDKVTSRRVNELLVSWRKERQSNRRTLQFCILLPFKISIAFVRTSRFVKKKSKTANEKGVNWLAINALLAC